MNKTTLESLEEALERLEQIDGMYSWAHLLYEVREALAECKPAPDGRIPKTAFTLEDIGKAAEMGREAGRIDALAEQALQKLSDFHQYMEATEPVKEPLVFKTNGVCRMRCFVNGVTEYYDEQGNVTMRLDGSEPVKQEPVAVISESAIGLVKLHSNGVSLPFGTPLYAAPVSAKREWVELEPSQLCEIEERLGLPIDSHDFETIGNAYIAAFKEKNK